MLCEFSYTNSESLPEIRDILAEIKNVFQGFVFHWRTLCIRVYMTEIYAKSGGNLVRRQSLQQQQLSINQLMKPARNTAHRNPSSLAKAVYERT